MSRNITITRTELGLTPLELQAPAAGYFVSDDWRPGGMLWQHYTAAGSPWVNGDRIVGQRLLSVDEIFTIYVKADTPAGLKAKVAVLAAALSQFRYTFTVEWDGAEYVYQANGAGELRHVSDQVDPAFHRAGWHQYQITIPRDPGLG
jgi:hypothetical protein